MKKRCLIVGAGEWTPIKTHVSEYGCIIAADGGYARLKKENITPDIVLGDFDSLGFIPEEKNVIRYPSEKDAPDMKIAVELAYEKGYKIIDIYGGTGGRFAHTLANIQNLAWLAERGVSACMYGENFTASALTCGKITFSEKEKGYISVFSLTEQSEGVCEKGLKYSLDNAVLRFDDPLGLSNEFTGRKAEISVKKGILLIITNNKNFKE